MNTDKGYGLQVFNWNFWEDLLLIPLLARYCSFPIYCNNGALIVESELKIIGQYAAMSIVQGGPGFPALHSNVYNYMVTGKYIGVHTTDEDVLSPIVVALLQEVS